MLCKSDESFDEKIVWVSVEAEDVETRNTKHKHEICATQEVLEIVAVDVAVKPVSSSRKSRGRRV